MVEWFKRMVGNWWVPISGSRFYYAGCWVPLNRFKKMVLEPYPNLADAQIRCNDLNHKKKNKIKER